MGNDENDDNRKGCTNCSRERRGRGGRKEVEEGQALGGGGKRGSREQGG